MSTQFTKMSLAKQESLYGGWGWIVAMMPYLIQSVITSISSVKMLQSDNGSFKFNGLESEWSTNKDSTSGTKTKEYFYAF